MRHHAASVAEPSMRVEDGSAPPSAHLAERQCDHRETRLEAAATISRSSTPTIEQSRGIVGVECRGRLVDAHGHLVVEAEHRGRATPGRCSEEVGRRRGHLRVGASPLDAVPSAVESGVVECLGTLRRPRVAGASSVVEAMAMRRWPAARRCATAVAAIPRSSGATADAPARPARRVDQHDRAARRRHRLGTSWCDIRASRIPSTRWSRSARTCCASSRGRPPRRRP